MNPKHIAIAFLPILLAACAQHPVRPSAETKPVSKPVEAKPAMVKPAEPKLPDVALSDDLLFEFLLGEIAGQRGDIGMATEAYVDMANKTRDPRIVKRALDISLYSGNNKDAMEMAKLLTTIDPESAKAKETLSALLAHSDNLEVARPNIEKLLSQQKGDNLAKSLMQLDSLFVRQADRKAVLSTVEGLTKPYLDLPEAHYAIAIAAFRAGEIRLALDEDEKAQSMRPDWETAALLKAQILEQTDKQALLPFLSDFLEKYPRSQEVRLAYAKVLVSEKKFEEAHKEFSELKKLFPKNPDVAFAVGLLSLQLGNFDEAISDFKDLLRIGYQNKDLVRFYIAQGYELKKSWNDAVKWYEAIGEGPQYLPARTRVAVILMQTQGISKARQYLHGIHTSNSKQKAFLVLAEAQLLHDSKDYRGAYSVLKKGVETYPDSPDLLYDESMAAEKMGKIREAERSLRKLIKLQPEYAQAYNALGYTLVEHTNRYKEALPLLQKALSLSPEDPFILDSMGWLQYKMGNIPSSLDFLERAYKGRKDPEIAAHLVEVLWAKGQHEDAEKLLKSSLKEHPDNDALLKSKRIISH